MINNGMEALDSLRVGDKDLIIRVSIIRRSIEELDEATIVNEEEEIGWS